jgi:hypothetical protein
MRKVVLILCCLWACPSTSQEAPDPQKMSEFTKAMRTPESKRQIVFLTQMALGSMGYGSGPFDGELKPNDSKAIASFRIKAGLPPKSDPLDFATFESIQVAYKETQKPYVMVPRLSVTTSIWNSYASAKGTWVIEGQEQGIPLQTTEIQCYKEMNQCFEATAMLQDGDYLASWLDTHEIDRWDDVEIVTKRDLNCVRYTMRISRVQKTVSALRAKINDSTTCKSVQDPDLRLRLADGMEALKTYNSKRSANVRKWFQADWTVLESAEKQR